MTDPGLIIAPPARLTWKDWFFAVSPIVLMITSLLTAGAYIGQVKENTRRIEAIEKRDDMRDQERDLDKDKLNTIDVRTARIEAKLEVLIPQKERLP